MKYLGNVKVTLLKERQKYKELFSPLSESEYADLRESVREAGVLNDLIVEKGEEGYIILSGHHRKAVAQEARHGRGPLLPRRNTRRNT